MPTQRVHEPFELVVLEAHGAPDARRKGYSVVAFYFFGLAALLIGVIVALSIRPKAALPALADHLNELDQLRAAGRISEEEYQRQSARMVR